MLDVRTKAGHKLGTFCGGLSHRMLPRWMPSLRLGNLSYKCNGGTGDRFRERIHGENSSHHAGAGRGYGFYKACLKLKIKEARNYAECEYGRQYGELASAGREECLVYAGVRSYIILARRARRSCRLFGIPSAEQSCVNCAYADLLHCQPPCNNCLRSPYAVHGETTDDAWKPTGKWQIP